MVSDPYANGVLNPMANDAGFRMLIGFPCRPSTAKAVVADNIVFRRKQITALPCFP